MAPDTAALVARLREYAGEVLHARHDAEPPYSNDYECAVAALEAADLLADDVVVDVQTPQVSPEMCEVALSAPEQFFAVECLLRSAANAEHVAERAEMWDLTPAVADTLQQVAQTSEDAAILLLILLCPTAEAFRIVFAELTRMVAV